MQTCTCLHGDAVIRKKSKIGSYFVEEEKRQEAVFNVVYKKSFRSDLLVGERGSCQQKNKIVTSTITDIPNQHQNVTFMKYYDLNIGDAKTVFIDTCDLLEESECRF